MDRTRRQLLVGAVAAAAGAAMMGERVGAAPGALPTADEIAQLFAGLPGTFTFRIRAPATGRTRELDLARDPGRQLFVASAIKAFVTVEALRQIDGPDVATMVADQRLPLDASVWSLPSPVFDPPNLTGTVSERTALEAMIMHSDNTGTDIVLRHIGPDTVRSFLASARLTSSAIPDSTRSFFGYLKGAPDPDAYTWDELVSSGDVPFVNPVLNTTTTLASSADDLVSFYSRALHGEFFEHAETLDLLRALLSAGDLIWVVPFPLGASAFGKGGSIDIAGAHALCAPGALFFDDVWVYFAFILNWDAAEPTDASTLAAFLRACAAALQRVKDSLAVPTSGSSSGRLPMTR